MAKRFQPFRDFSHGKKPKLDIAVGSRQRVETLGNRLPAQREPKEGSQENLWDDDDDDEVILLATQNAESQAAAAAANIVESEMTFSEFAPNLQGTSTQQMRQRATTTTDKAANGGRPVKDVIAAMFEDDDDDFDSLATGAMRSSHEPLFKKPTPVSKETTTTETSVRNDIPANTAAATAEPSEPVTMASAAPAATGAQSQSAARRQLAAERQMKFFMDRVDALKKENAKMQNALGLYKERMESKDGETSLLRDEVRHMKQQIHALQMEKIMITKSAQAENQTKIEQLNKVVNAKETELQMKTYEYSMLKLKQADETRRFEMNTTCNESLAVAVMSNDANTTALENGKQCNAHTIRQLYRMDHGDPGEMLADAVGLCNIETDVYEHTTKDEVIRQQLSLFQIEFDELQKINTQIKNTSVATRTPKERFDIQERTIASACRVFPEFWSYTHNLDFPNNCTVYAPPEYAFEKDTRSIADVELTQASNLFAGECVVTLRRYVAVLAHIAKRTTSVAHGLLQQRHGDYLLLQIPNDAIAKLSFCKELCDHFGLLEAFAELLHSLVMQYDNELAPAQRELIFDLLKQLVFARPSAWILARLSNVMLCCTYQPALLELCCTNSTSDTFFMDRAKRALYRYADGSCLLQVYAGLLEIAFNIDKPLQRAHFELLAVICERHVRFVYNCLMSGAQFIVDMLPSNEDELHAEHSGNAARPTTAAMDNASGRVNTAHTSTSTISGAIGSTSDSNRNPAGGSEMQQTRGCECYGKLSQSIISLVFQLMQQWLSAERTHATRIVAEISKITLHLLNAIFREYYITSLFRDAEETTKHQLGLLCTWWSEHAATFAFHDIQLRFLAYLQDAHFMPQPLLKEGSNDIVAHDISEWHRLVDNVDEEQDAESVQRQLAEQQEEEEAEADALLPTKANVEKHFKKLNLVNDI